MNVRRPDAQPQVAPVTPAPVRATPTTPAAAAPVQTDASRFADGTSSAGARLGSAQTADHPVGSIALGERPLNGPVDLGSAQGKAAVKTVLDSLDLSMSAVGSVSKEFQPRSIEQDELGMMHVRLDRVHNGLKVFGEQIIGHLKDGELARVTGDAKALPPELGAGESKLTAEEAKAVALNRFERAPQSEPTVEKVIAQDADGNYKVAYRVEAQNLTSGPEPLRMNYLVDAETGKVMSEWNQMGGIHLPGKNARPADSSSGGPREAPIATGKAAPEADIVDEGTITSEITIDDDFPLEQVSVDLNLDHTYRGDLVVTLTSPSGQSVTLSDREGGGDDGIKGTFDLEQFAGESGKGKWTLTVTDAAKQDVGKLHDWSLKLIGKDPNPPPPPPPSIDDQTQYSGTVQIDASRKPDGSFVLKDGSRGKGVETKDAQNRGSGAGASEIKDANNLWGEVTDDPRNQAGVDAQYGAQSTYDFYKDILGRDSIDGKGEKLVSNVHINQNYVNAFWDGKQMNYGDGDGQDASVLTTLDIAGHEITHGLTERTAGLIYRGESGGLNEAMSDIMGTGVEWYASQKNAAVKFDYSLGEDCWTPNNGDPNDALRYMNDPTADGYSVDHYSNYPKQTEVHGSSGIANNAFYLLTNGGKNKTSGLEVQDGIGMEKGLKIFGRALMNYMTPSTTFAQAREACINAATDLYGADSVEVQKVKESWTAVGVG